ncbi:structure-specific endonuclease subunit SLX4 isoform X2 [Choloepus didactylus]|uniref:structure-specific endonuclease subunit SLX4 isoform X2 n=1 Tax=Choloepus didactylus TaxID=27675 RepID=UPI00189F4488|nr:structure-specific endonuclease subunit SLX4 isoform X2 [Choloepus didactylus]
MMDESDDDFKELCASFFQRVKKNGNKEVSEGKKTQKASDGTQMRSKLKRTKQTTTKKETLPVPKEKKPRSGSQAPRTKRPRATKPQESETAPNVKGERAVLAPACSQQSTQTEGAPSRDSQPPPSCLPPVLPSPSKSRTAELVLQRMQQFKRRDPLRLTHAFEECSLEAATEEDVPEGPQEETVVGNGDGPGPPATESDAAVALALQQEFKQERAAAHADGLEEKGWFFCQICQKNLSAMNVTRREQHVNRCLDEAEKTARPPVPPVPECPICGKLFLTARSRSSHLKQCAVKMEVCPQLLLQAVRLQTAQPEGGCIPVASGFSNQAGGVKRKGAAHQEPQKRRKVSGAETPSEDLLVAVALSRSEVEQCKAVPALKLESAFATRIKLGAEKKRRKKKPPVSPPQLLVQDSETTGRQIEDRVATLFAEEVELSSTPPLPASRILKEKLEKPGWHLQLSERKNFLWDGSALTGAWAMESFYTASLVPPLVPQLPAQGLPKEPMCPSMPPDPPEPDAQTPPAPHSSPPTGCGYREDQEEPEPRNPSPSSSQREHQALQDLMELAGEGEAADLVLSGLPSTGFILPPREDPLEGGGSASLSLGVLASDFSAMVNNPQLSDVQLQLDSGEVLYAHKFVLYARCPRLSQYVNSEGFFAAENGDLRSQRVLLSDVSSEAACAFLRYLYAGDTGLPAPLTPDLSSLALRFGVSELVHLCQQAPVTEEPGDGQGQVKEGDRCESREENFQELLRSMWADEEEEAGTVLKSEDREEDRDNVNEAEIEEIYEFAATQRKLLQEERATERKQAAEQLTGVRPGSACGLASVQVSTGHVESSGQGGDEAPARRKSARQSVLQPLPGQGADGKEDAETPEQTLSHCRRSRPSGEDQAERQEGSLLHSFHDYEPLLSRTRREYAQPSQVRSDRAGKKKTVTENEVGVPCTPSRHQAPPSQPPQGGSPPRPHPHPRRSREPSLPTPQSPSAFPKVGSPIPMSPILPPSQKRDCGVLTLLIDPGHPRGKECSYVLEHKNKGVLLSPEESPSIDLTQPKPGRLNPRSLNSPASMNKEDEVILLLDSDEELELEQTKIKSVAREPPEERKGLEISPQSSELFSVIDIDADQEHSPSPPSRATELPQGQEEESRGPLGSRGPLRLFCDRESSAEEDSTTDTSWLVPATPLASRGRDSSSQTQITGLQGKPSRDQKTQLQPRASLESREENGASSKLSVIVPQTSLSHLVPLSPGNSDAERRVHRSPPSWHCVHFSPTAARLISGGPTGFTEQPQKRLPPEPGPASEVVELEDSEDEQEAVSHQASGLPLLDRSPPTPANDCCWGAEPLSPVPVDPLSLERAGPLSTSSPSSRTRAAPGSHDLGSPGPLGTTPIRGSCPNRTPETSPQAGVPRSCRPSFLNSALWDDWDGEEQNSPEILSRAQKLSADPAQKSEGFQTPSANQKKNLPPKVPITPMPRYSIMETPVLKKELDRFGVRPLPKRQMVLKLKEIFQYTHQTLGSDSDDELQAPQPPLDAPSGCTRAPETSQTSRAGGCSQLEATAGPAPRRLRGPVKAKGPGHREQQAHGSLPALHLAPAEDIPRSPEGDARLPASQESPASADGSDGTFSSQSSSSSEFGAAFESGDEDEEDEEGVPASQAAARAADTEEAVRRYIRSNPALYRKILLYQPCELAELRAELRQHGVRVPAGQLLRFLDSHCITFTTAAARKETLTRRRPPRGQKKGPPGPRPPHASVP